MTQCTQGNALYNYLLHDAVQACRWRTKIRNQFKTESKLLNCMHAAMRRMLIERAKAKN